LILLQDATQKDGSSGNPSAIGLENLGDLHGQLALCLGIACIVIYICIAASTKSIGKVTKLGMDFFGKTANLSKINQLI
jgi:hypothetical protein